MPPIAMPPPLDRLRVTDALISVIAAVGLLILGGGLLLPLGGVGVAAAQLLFVAGPVVWIATIRGGAHRRLGIALPTARATAGAVLVGGSLWFVTLWLVAPLSQMWFGNGDLEKLQKMAESTSPIMLIAGFAVAPAVCEELLFRGGLTRSLAPRIGGAGAVVVSAVMFSLFHASAIRLMPTLFIGLVLGLAVVRTRSVVPGMIIHGINNGIAVTISEKQAAWLASYTEILGIAAVLLSAGGIWLVWTGPTGGKSTT